MATYDPARSGAGYLYLSQDAEHYPAFWELIEALGEAGVRLYDRAAAMLEGGIEVSGPGKNGPVLTPLPL